MPCIGFKKFPSLDSLFSLRFFVFVLIMKDVRSCQMPFLLRYYVVFVFLLLMWSTTIDFQMLTLHSWDKLHVVLVYNSLFICCRIWFARIKRVHICKRHWSILTRFRSRGIFVCQGQTLVRLGFTLIFFFFPFLFPQENLQRQAGLRLFRVRKIVLIMTIECFPDQGEKKKLMFTSAKMIWFHSGEQIFSYSHAPPQLFLINLKPNSIFLFLFYRGGGRWWDVGIYKKRRALIKDNY